MGELRGGKRRPGWGDLAAVLALCTIAVLFYRHIVVGNLILSGVDAFTYFYPYRAYAASVIREGRIPLWNPYLFMGVPFFANAQSAVFYPLNLLLCQLPAPRLVAWSIVLHVAMAALFAYGYARYVLRLSPLPAMLAASAFAWGGFLSGQVEHINQLNVSAWFPLLLLLWELRRKRRWLALLGIAGVVGVGLLAGHAQSSYICLLGLAVYALLPAFVPPGGERGRFLPAFWARLGPILLDLALVVLVGVGLAAVQLLPTAELSRLSMRSGGLSYREAVAFSFKPSLRWIRYAFVPSWQKNLGDVFGGDFFTEYMAYVGVVSLILAFQWVVGLIVSWIRRRARKRAGPARFWARPEGRLLILAGLGVFLALGLYNPLYFLLYKLVPGFSLFRVPARWLLLYAFALPMLAGVGLQQLLRLGSGKRSVWVTPIVHGGLVALTLGELFVAAQALPLAHPTAPEAFSSLRTAPAHILAAQRQELLPGRVLGMSDILFDPGDLAEMEQMFGGSLSDRQRYDYVVCAKRKEVLAPNLPLARRIYTVDGYDGGVLPLARYVDLQRLFVPADRVSPDGRLCEQLERIPPSRLLSLLGVRYVITDKVHDVWIEDVFYDLAFEAVLAQDGTRQVASDDFLPFEATALGMVAYVEGAVGENAAVATVRLNGGDGLPDQQLTLYAKQLAGQKEARQAVRLSWKTPLRVERLEVEVLPFDGRLHVQGVTLIDERDGSNVPVLLSTQGRYRLVHSGDVKVYEVLDALPRAYVVPQSIVAEDDQAVLSALADPAFDVAQTVVLSSPGFQPSAPQPSSSAGSAAVEVLAYAPERVALRVSLDAPGYLVLTDAYYPGWEGTVDGQPVDVLRANLYFRAVSLEKGTHTVEFLYHPTSYIVELAISLIFLASVLGAVIVLVVQTFKLRYNNA